VGLLQPHPHSPLFRSLGDRSRRDCQSDDDLQKAPQQLIKREETSTRFLKELLHDCSTSKIKLSQAAAALLHLQSLQIGWNVIQMETDSSKVTYQGKCKLSIGRGNEKEREDGAYQSSWKDPLCNEHDPLRAYEVCQFFVCSKG